MDIFDRLKQDHREIEELFALIETAVEDQQIEAVKENFRFLREEITLHSRAEEEVVYQPLHLMTAESEEDIAMASEEQHKLVDYLLEQLTRLNPESQRWRYRFQLLRQIVSLHIEEEEEETFAVMNEYFAPEEFLKMGEQMSKVKEVYASQLEAPANEFDLTEDAVQLGVPLDSMSSTQPSAH